MRRLPINWPTILILLGWPAAVIVGLAGYLTYLRAEHVALAAPSGVDTLIEFARVMPPARSFQRVHKDGRVYFVWTGEHLGILALPSGPSQYVFDDAGALIDWTSESDEGGSVDRLLSSASSRHDASLDETVQAMRQSAQ